MNKKEKEVFKSLNSKIDELVKEVKELKTALSEIEKKRYRDTGSMNLP